MFLVPLMKPVILIANTQQQNEKHHKDNNKSNSFLQNPAPSFNETDINTLCYSKQLPPEITTDTALLNKTTETSPTVPTDIQTPITTSNLNDTSNLTKKTILKIEAQLSALKSHVDCELSTFTSKIDAFSDSLKNTLENLHKRNSSYSNTNLLQQNITFLEN